MICRLLRMRWLHLLDQRFFLLHEIVCLALETFLFALDRAPLRYVLEAEHDHPRVYCLRRAPCGRAATGCVARCAENHAPLRTPPRRRCRRAIPSAARAARGYPTHRCRARTAIGLASPRSRSRRRWVWNELLATRIFSSASSTSKGSRTVSTMICARERTSSIVSIEVTERLSVGPDPRPAAPRWQTWFDKDRIMCGPVNVGDRGTSRAPSFVELRARHLPRAGQC